MDGLKAAGLSALLGTVALALVLAVALPAVAAERCGDASWYGHQHHGRLTATGERFDQWGMTAAMMDRSMFGKRVRVTNQANGKSVVVKINDTGNFAKYGRVIDMSRGSFAKLASTDAGVIRVCLEVV